MSKEIIHNDLTMREMTLAPNHYITKDGRIFKYIRPTSEMRELPTRITSQDGAIKHYKAPELRFYINAKRKTIRNPLELYIAQAWKESDTPIERVELIDGNSLNLSLDNIRVIDTVKNEIIKSGISVKHINGTKNSIVTEDAKIYKMKSRLPNVADPIPLLPNGDIDFDNISDFTEVNQHVNASGYLRVTLTGDKTVHMPNGRVKSNIVHLLSHRAVTIAFIPNPENKPEVNHIDGIKTNNHVSNLEWVWSDENETHAVKMGLMSPDKVKKTTDEQDEQLIHEIMSGLSNKELAEKYNVSDRTIREIRSRRARPQIWARLYPDADIIPNPVSGRRNALSRESVIEIMNDMYNYMNNKTISVKYGVSSSAIEKIRNGVNHVGIHKEVFNSKPFPKGEIDIFDKISYPKEIVLEVLDKIMGGFNNSSISEKYGINIDTISRIRGKRMWKDVWDEYYTDMDIPHSVPTNSLGYKQVIP